MFLGVLVLVVGVVWLLNGLGIISADLWQIILPLIVILAGFSLMGKHCNCGKCWFCKKKDCKKCCDSCVKKDNGQM